MSPRSLTRIGTLLAGLLLLSACGVSVPDDKQDYVGHWQGPDMTLAIGAEGNVAYWRLKESGVTVEVDAPLQGFQGDDFVVGVGFLKTTFVVNEPPRHEDGRWRMVVDGVALERCIDFDCTEEAIEGLKVEILDRGVMGPEASDGSRPVVKSTALIPAQVGDVFGARYRLDGASSGGATLTLRLDHPPIRDTETGELRDHFVADRPVASGREQTVAFRFNDEASTAPGSWTLRILHGPRVLARQSFAVHRP